MTDDLDKALAKQDAPVEEAVSAVLEMLRDLTPDSLDLSKPEVREQSVEAYEVLKNLGSVLNAKAHAIRLAWLRHLVRTGDRRVIVPWAGRKGAVTYEPPRNVWVVPGNEAAAMHRELSALVEEGLLTEEELELAVRPVLAYKSDHSRLNALARKSERMKAIIDAHRTSEAGDPMSGKISFPGGS